MLLQCASNAPAWSYWPCHGQTLLVCTKGSKQLAGQHPLYNAFFCLQTMKALIVECFEFACRSQRDWVCNGRSCLSVSRVAIGSQDRHLLHDTPLCLQTMKMYVMQCFNLAADYGMQWQALPVCTKDNAWQAGQHPLYNAFFCLQTKKGLDYRVFSVYLQITKALGMQWQILPVCTKTGK